MAIKIYNNKIMIGNYTLEESNTGITFDGIVQASSFRREGNFQGTNFGFTAGGFTPPGSNVIDKYPFPVNSNATDLGDLTLARVGISSMSSDLHGYSAGGYAPPLAAATNVIDKFKFATNGNATDVGDLSTSVYSGGGNSCKRVEQGFAAGSSLPTGSNVMNRIPFVAETNAFDIGDLSQARGLQASQSSETHGYNSGGELSNGGAGVNTIDKFPMFATNYVLSTDVGDLTQARTRLTGQSSTTHGYSSGGVTSWPPGSGYLSTVDKFPFSSDSNASSVGNLTAGRAMGGGSSSDVSGYTAGGNPTFNASTNAIDKFPFATDSNATSVGTLTAARGLTSGFQI